MYGAIIGDMVGAPYEFDRGNKTKDFTMFTECTEYTDDSVMTVAVAEALMDAVEQGKGDWWLRSIASNTDPVADRISFAGRYGSGEMNEHMAVRPALWISLNP